MPLKDLFVFQRVSRQWSEVIAGSLVLQEKMFLRLQSTAPPETWFGVGIQEFDFFHPLPSGGSVRIDAGEPSGFQRVSNSSATYTKLYIPTTLNPGLQMYYPLQPTLQRLARGKREAISIRVRPADLQERSSLWNMYISDPPCRNVELNLPIEPEGGSQIKSDEGLKVGDILVAAARFADEHCFGPRHESVYDVDFVTLSIDLLRDGEVKPVVPSKAEQATMFFSFERAL